MSAVADIMQAVSDKLVRPFDLRLRCPQCALDHESRKADSACVRCGFRLVQENGIWKALSPSRAAHFARFMKEYQAVRQAEKRGSQTADYYLALPYKDLSGHNQQQWGIRGRTYAYLEKNILPQLAVGGKRLRVLDLGAGNGWMSYRIALLGHEPVAVDLLTSDLDGLGAAAHYERALKNLFPRFQAELGRLPFADSQFDVAIFNASFHYSENYRETLGEAIRCLRPHGTVIIADTSWYRRDESGRTMVRERQAYFIKLYGFPSDGIANMEYLTDERLDELASACGLRWKILTPFYGLSWAMRPLMAKLKRKREPSRFRIYVAEVAK